MGGSISPVLRQEIQTSSESVRMLARRHNISPATVQKWRNRTGTDELPRGPKPGQCTAVPDYVEEAMVLFRQQTLLPLDDCLYALRIGNPTLSRATLHRYYRKWGLGSLSNIEGLVAPKRTLAMGYVHLAYMLVRIKEGVVVLLVGFDRVSKYSYGTIERQLSPDVVGQFVGELADNVPFRIHTLQTSNGPLFEGPVSRVADACLTRGICHRIAAPPQTSVPLRTPSMEGGGDAEHDFNTLEDVQQRLKWEVTSYNNTCKLKSLGGLTPTAFVRKHLDRIG